MERQHLEYAVPLDPAPRGRIFLLGHWDESEVPDPYRLGEKSHRLACAIIAQAIDQWIGKR